MEDDEIFFLEMLEIGQRIQSRKTSSKKTTQAMLSRIEKIDSKLRSYATVMTEQALAEAHRADQEISSGHVRGPLHGVPIAIKDLLWTADAPTSHGMTIHKSFQAKEDATVVRRLRDAGAVVLGKLQMTEGAFGSHHPQIPAPLNPWDHSLWSGVSSSGSGVATAAGLCFASLGTDTGGSIRYPSAANGVTGLKPSWGRVSRHGAFGLAASMDHIGPMTRSVADAAAILQVIAGADPKDPTASLHAVPDYLAQMTRGLSGLTIGIDTGWAMERVDAPTRSMLRDAMEQIKRAGGTIREVRYPNDEMTPQNWQLLCAVETAIEHETTFPVRRGEYGPALASLIDTGGQISAIDHQKRQMYRKELRGRIDALFQEVDLLLAPVTEAGGMTVEFVDACMADPERLAALLRYTGPFDMSGHPTITLPGGVSQSGAPLAFQFVAARFAEDLLVRAGWGYQRITHWHHRHPPI